MALVGYLIALLISFYLLAEVSDRYFVVSLDKIAARFNMSHDMAGATLMAIGSSAPELFVAIIALLRPGDHQEIGVGTIVGSALFNILVIIGASAVVRKAVLAWQPVVRDLTFYSISILILFFVLRDGQVELLEAGLLFGFYFLYLLAVVLWRKIFKYEELDDIDQEEEEDEDKVGWKKILTPLDWLLDKVFPSSKFYFATFFISVLWIAILAWVLVESAIGISHILHVPEVVIALTVLAIGTSVPDMIGSVIVARQGRGGMAVSNAVGSNIFDIFVGLGFPWLIMIAFSNKPIEAGIEGLTLSVILLFASVVFIFGALLFKKWEMSQRMGYFLVGLYVVYLIFEVVKVYLPAGIF